MVSWTSIQGSIHTFSASDDHYDPGNVCCSREHRPLDAYSPPLTVRYLYIGVTTDHYETTKGLSVRTRETPGDNRRNLSVYRYHHLLHLDHVTRANLHLLAIRQISNENRSFVIESVDTHRIVASNR